MTDGWGWPKPSILPTESSDRAARRAEDRDRRARERIAAAEQRSEARMAARDAASQDRVRARDVRRIEETQRSATRMPAEKPDSYVKRRASGARARTGEEVKRERDTRGYTTIVDPDRIRALADRGASLSGLAATFDITTDDVEAILRGDE